MLFRNLCIDDTRWVTEGRFVTSSSLVRRFSFSSRMPGFLFFLSNRDKGISTKKFVRFSIK